MKDIIEQLDAEIQRKQPPGILVSPTLFDALYQRGRIAKKPLMKSASSAFSRDTLDGKIDVTSAFLADGEHFLFPPICNEN